MGCCPCASVSPSGGNMEWAGWEVSAPAGCIQMVLDHTLLWHTAPWITPLLQEFSRDSRIPWRAVGSSCQPACLALAVLVTAGQGAEHRVSTALALLSSPIPPPRISKVFIGAVPCSPPGWVWAGQGGGTAAPGAARADLASLLTFMPISISSAACPHAGMLPGRLGSPSQGAQQSCRELGLRWPG